MPSISQIIKSRLWTRGGTAKENYCQSIGYGVTNYGRTVIEFDKSGSTTLCDREIHIDGSLSTIGHVDAGSLTLYGGGGASIDIAVTPRDYSNDPIELRIGQAKLVFNEEDTLSDLTEDQKDTANNIATFADIERIENKLGKTEEETIAFLKILRYVPELSGKIDEIDSILDTHGEN